MRTVSCQPRIAGSPFVFPGDVGEGHFVGLPQVVARVFARAGIEDATLHTLRHTFASVAASLNFSELTIAGLLGHASRGVTQGYVHLDCALVLAAAAVSDELAGLLGESGDAAAGPEPRARDDVELAERLVASMS